MQHLEPARLALDRLSACDGWVGWKDPTTKNTQGACSRLQPAPNIWGMSVLHALGTGRGCVWSRFWVHNFIWWDGRSNLNHLCLNFGSRWGSYTDKTRNDSLASILVASFMLLCLANSAHWKLEVKRLRGWSKELLLSWSFKVQSAIFTKPKKLPN